MRFWDASAIVPLLVREPASGAMLGLLEADAEMLVWWATPVEITSALARREREGQLPADASERAWGALRQLRTQWNEVLPTEAVRALAMRMVRVHPVRAADGAQLAAAMIAAEHEPGTLELVSLDARLNDAARREGFAVITG